MLQINQLSFWEKELYFNDLDYVIIGAGIVGFSTALSLREKHPTARILVLERSFLPTGASTKNAGFACFGSPTEVLDDLQHLEEENVIQLMKKRYQGLQLLCQRLSKKTMDYQDNGSFELFRNSEKAKLDEVVEQLPYLNDLAEAAIQQKNTYELHRNTFEFNDVCGLIKNNFEGQLDTGKMMYHLHRLAASLDILCLFGISVESWEESPSKVHISTSKGTIESRNLLIATNGLSQKILPHEDVLPARAQVLITQPIPNLTIKGTFHYEQGYYYFRNIGNRILLGGGRNLAKETETTTLFENTPLILDRLKELLATVILPSTPFEIEHQWTGIMGVGKTKEPIVKKISEHVGIGIRLGGMGVALGSLVGQELASVFNESKL